MKDPGMSDKEICLSNCDYMISWLAELRELLRHDDDVIQKNAYRASFTVDCLNESLGELEWYFEQMCELAQTGNSSLAGEVSSGKAHICSAKESQSEDLS